MSFLERQCFNILDDIFYSAALGDLYNTHLKEPSTPLTDLKSPAFLGTQSNLLDDHVGF